MKKLSLLLAGLLLTGGLVGCSPKKADTSLTPSTPELGQEVEKVEEEKQDMVVYDVGGIKVTYKGTIKTGIMGASLQFLVENNSDTQLTVGTDSMSVNGFMINMFSGFHEDIAPGKKANADFNLLSSELEEIGITAEEITEVEFIIKVLDMNDFMNGYSHQSEPIIINK